MKYREYKISSKVVSKAIKNKKKDKCKVIVKEKPIIIIEEGKFYIYL